MMMSSLFPMSESGGDGDECGNEAKRVRKEATCGLGGEEGVLGGRGRRGREGIGR